MRSQDISDAYQDWVEYRDGRVSLAFEKAPVEFVLDAMRTRTGLQILIPAAMRNNLLSLQVTQLPLERAVRSLIGQMGGKNFALMYDDAGLPSRAIVLGATADTVTSDANRPSVTSAQTRQETPQPLTAEERQSLQKNLERWGELTEEERGRVQDRLKTLPPSEEREQLVAEYGRRILGIPEREAPAEQEAPSSNR